MTIEYAAHDHGRRCRCGRTIYRFARKCPSCGRGMPRLLRVRAWLGELGLWLVMVSAGSFLRLTEKDADE
jgi:hypothetical protein